MSTKNSEQHGVITKASQHSVAATADKLIGILESKGFIIFAAVDHAAGASKAGLSLPATRTIIFGNPQMGTLLMQSAASIALDLPLKIAVYEKESGEVEIAYNEPQWLLDRHNISDRNEIVEKMTAGLNAITDAATQ